MLRTQLLIVGLLALSLASPPAAAQEGPQGSPQAEALLQQAEALYEQLEYETALQVLIQVHQVQGVAPLQRARSFLYMGVCFTALGKAEDAVQAFMALLKIKPDFRLPDGVSPSINEMFKEALSRLKLPGDAGEAPGPGAQQPGPGAAQPGSSAPAGDSGVEVKASGPDKATAGKPVAITVMVTDPEQQVSRLILRWRRVGGPDYSTVSLSHTPGDEQTRGTIPAITLDDKEGRLHFYVEAMDEDGMTLAHDGSMNEPLEVTLTAAKGGSSSWKWWVIGVGAGLAVAGGVVAAVLLTRPDDSDRPLPNYGVGTVILK